MQELQVRVELYFGPPLYCTTVCYNAV